MHIAHNDRKNMGRNCYGPKCPATNSLSIFDHHALGESPLVRNEIDLQGRIQDFWKGGSYVKKGFGFPFAEFISVFLNTP